MIRRRHVAAALAALFVAAACQIAEAAPSASDKAEAKALVAEARAATKQKRSGDAATALRKADALDPSPQTKLDLARALNVDGQLVEASQVLHVLIDGSSASPAAKRVAVVARKLLADVEPRVPWVQIAVVGPSAGEATTTVDDKEVDATAEIPADPGEHVVAASADGYERVEKRITLAEGEHQKVKLKLPKLLVEATAKEEQPPSPGGSVVPHALALGVGVAGVVVGAVFGVMAFNETSNVEANCNEGRCPQDQAEALDVARANGTVSTVGFIVGGVGVATFIVLLVASGGDDDPPEPVTAGVRPYVSFGHAGLHGSF